ncbi:MAG: UDP-3-O-(3-hydroxymyristoyl)glucosamine N-acyltransferase [Synechococcales cyanobacterium T60_A2020_003]|nr:UDP-3-O-(3-hydroxymyristoyl)glucosamine N-acyltransferase [Synechococcales cyanobacterium T60_A2020_003]
MKCSELVQRLSSDDVQVPIFLADDPELTSVAAVDQASPGTISYIDGDAFADWVHKTEASALILPLREDLQTAASDRGIAWISTPQPRLLFAQVIRQFYTPFRPAPGIHPTAVIDPSAQIGQDVAIGAHAVVQANVTLGDGVCIHPNVVIYPGVTIGAGTILHANCVIQERSHLGANCVIQSGAVIGAEGFGFVPTAEGWFKMEQSGYVVLEDGVEIGCNSAVDRPAVGETRIRRNTKLDNLVHIGHGCQIGEACAMAAQVGLAGGVEVGNRVILAGQVGVSNQAKIGDGVIASSKSGIHGEIAPGEVVSGYPAVPNRLWLKASAIYNRLPEMYQSLRQIRRQLTPPEQSDS